MGKTFFIMNSPNGNEYCMEEWKIDEFKIILHQKISGKNKKMLH